MLIIALRIGIYLLSCTIIHCQSSDLNILQNTENQVASLPALSFSGSDLREFENVPGEWNEQMNLIGHRRKFEIHAVFSYAFSMVPHTVQTFHIN